MATALFEGLKFCSREGRLVVGLLILATSICSLLCRAQSAAEGTIRGSIVDPDHRVIAGATVTIRNNDFTSERVLTTDADSMASRNSARQPSFANLDVRFVNAF